MNKKKICMTLFSGFMFSGIITSRITFLLCSNVAHSFLDDRVENMWHDFKMSFLWSSENLTF